MMNRVFRWLLLPAGFCLAAVTGLCLWLFADLPGPQAIHERLAMPSVRITDRHGRLLYDILDAETGRHQVLPLSSIPLAVQQATLATEDRNFYQNPGVDLIGILRAFWINLRGGEVLAGGSTITQQVARNLLLEADERGQRTVRRKLRESWLAWRVARQMEKDEILAFYLNQMYYGAMAYGVEAAAQTYFSQSASELTLAQSALLAGLPQAPAAYNPFANPAAAQERQRVVLSLMVKDGYISQEQLEQAAREPLYYDATPYPVTAPHFVMMVKKELDDLFSQDEIYQSGGLTVRTTLDLDWQQQAERIVVRQLNQLNKPDDGGPSHRAGSAALVAMDPQGGEILSLVGSADYFDAGHGGAINMAVVPRQPGSALKPIIYAAALSAQHSPPWTAATMIPDVRTVFMTHEGEPYVPVNFSRQEHGPVLLRQALAASLNIPAVVTLQAIGLETAMDLAADMGINSLGEPDEYDLSLALGGGAVTLLDLTAAYGAFANGGSRLVPSLILDVVDARGELVYAPSSPQPVKVLDERVAWLINDILSDDQARQLSFGTNSLLKLDRTAAVKTGTTNDFHDNWTVGYTPQLVVGVWVGNADNEPMRDVTGISGAGPIWHQFMRTVLAGQADASFPQPPGLVQAQVCLLSGLLPGEACPYRRLEWFLAGTQPVAQDTFYKLVTLNRRTGLLAEDTTPPEERLEQRVVDLPPALHSWARQEGLLLLDDLLLASGSGMGELGETADIGPELSLVAPDPQTHYRISAALPRDAQRLRLAAVADAGVSQVTLWLDGQPVASLDIPPYETWWPLSPGQHQAWAEGRDLHGRHLSSRRVTFTVRDVGEE